MDLLFFFEVDLIAHRSGKQTATHHMQKPFKKSGVLNSLAPPKSNHREILSAEDHAVTSDARSSPSHLDPDSSVIFCALKSSMYPRPTPRQLKVSRSLYQFIDASTDAYKHIIPSSGLET